MRPSATVYDRWLPTLGGGERYALSLAAALAEDFDVTVLSHDSVSRQQIHDTLGLDLPRVEFCTIPFRSDYASVIEASAGTNLFVNASHADFFVPRARANALIVYFPSRPDSWVPVARYPRWLRPRRAWHRVWLEQGFSAPRKSAHGWFREIDPSARMRVELPSGPPNPRLRLSFRTAPGAGHAPVRVDFLIDGRDLHQPANVVPGQHTQHQLDLPLAGPDSPTATLELRQHPTDRSTLLTSLRLESAQPWFPLERLLRSSDVRHQPGSPELQLRASLQGYQELVSISEYARQWTRAYWGRESSVLYPPVPAPARTALAGPRDQLVLSVGRFFPGQHNKQHAVLIGAFRELVDSGTSGWELHIAGGWRADVPEHRAYLDDLKRSAQGYPIHLLPNAPSAALDDLYRRATIYWHAAGFGQDAEREPARFEHFGITTAEAMAAGCVPLVFGAGGSAEIVEHERSGLHWHALRELVDMTRRLTRAPELAARLAAQAREAAKRYGEDQFRAGARSLARRLNAHTP
ncbi:MAG: glycosyltransferase family 4 protein [Chloroflexota bacterium]